MSLSLTVRKIVNVKYSFLKRSFKNAPFRLLDVGAGNHSASKITSIFPHCEYYGLDLNKDYANSEADFRVMKGFYELDLTKLDYSAVPDNYFDGILMSHVIEHLYNGDEVLPLLIPKLKSNGRFYIEYPGIKSTKLPSMYGTLNFKDDDTHVRLYSVPELKKVFEANNCTVLNCGTRRNYYYIIALPLRALLSMIKLGKLQGNVFWDLLGFAEFLEVKKK